MAYSALAHTPIADAHRTWHSHRGVLGVVWLHRTVYVGLFIKRREWPAALSTGPYLSFSTMAPEDPGRGCDRADSVALAGPYLRPDCLDLDPRRVIFAIELEVAVRSLPRTADPTLVVGVLATAWPAGLIAGEIAILKGSNCASILCAPPMANRSLFSTCLNGQQQRTHRWNAAPLCSALE